MDGHIVAVWVTSIPSVKTSALIGTLEEFSELKENILLEPQIR
jgi:hypothetical protein